MERTPADIRKFIRELFGGFLLLCALLLLIGLLTYDSTDPSLNHIQTGNTSPNNKAGLFGAYAAGFLDDIFGLGALIWPCIFAILGIVYLSSTLILRWWRWTGFFLLTLCFMVTATALDLRIGDLTGGGIIGNTLDLYSTRYLSPFGSFLLWLFIALTGIQLVVNFSWLSLLQAVFKYLNTFRQNFKLHKALFLTSKNMPQKLNLKFLMEKFKITKSSILPKLKHASCKIINLITDRGAASLPPAPLSPLPLPSELHAQDDDDPFKPAQKLSPDGYTQIPCPVSPSSQTAQTHNAIAPASSETDTVESRMPEIESGISVKDNNNGILELPNEDNSNTSGSNGQENQTGLIPDLSNTVIDTSVKITSESAPLKLFTDKPHYVFPGPELLTPPVAVEAITANDLAEKGRALMSCFQNFDIQGELTRITPGPVVTMFEVRPAPGIRVSKITNLTDDLGLALKATAVRIQAPVPGTDTVGIEIPNDKRETVNFRELIESADFHKNDGPLTMILGKNIAGHPFMADLSKMPHMLVAGATGAGKSVCLNSILLSLLYQHSPETLRLLLVDPKRIEMAVYSGLPHLVHPVVTEMEDAKNALAWAVDEMDKRFKTFMRLGVRNIDAYNKKLASYGQSVPENLSDLHPLSYMVIIIDELADLILTASKEVMPKIQRLAQLARAAGIHMIVATQRPSIDVVTGLVKAQFPSRISFLVSSKHDSHTILDQMGAEHLLGRGDMLFKPPGGRLFRLHGPFVSDEEVQRVVNHWKNQQEPDYQVDFSHWETDTPSGNKGCPGSDASDDPLYEETKEFVLEQGRISISLLQRRFRIGFTRSARIVEQLERDGIIGPADGSKPRTVIR